MRAKANQCPRCSKPVTATPDDQGYVTCTGCGSRLRSRAALGTSPPAPTSNPEAPIASDPKPAPAAPPPPSVAPVGLELVLSEIRALRQVQIEILDLIKSRRTVSIHTSPSIEDQGLDDDGADGVPPIRSQHRKTVLLVDDDPESRRTAVEALEQAQVPVRIAEDGGACVAAIAEEKPDVIVLEVALEGSMAGKDVINMIKATMEWVDIPIILYTRVPIHSQKDARTTHGADDFVLKGTAGPEALVSKVVALFRKG